MSVGQLELFRQGIFSTALTVDMFNESLDIPEANLIVFLRTTYSPTVFLHQLGRGLRIHENKDKLIVLDFVSNCERVAYVFELWKRINDKQEEFESLELDPKDQDRPDRGEREDMFSLNVDTVEFTEKILPIIDLMARLKAELYETWQEASAVAISHGLTTQPLYQQGRSVDSKLPSNPNIYYHPDFPGWTVFCGGEVKDYYGTWQDARDAALRLGITTPRIYQDRYHEDKRLHSHPRRKYKDFPGWTIFFGSEVKDLCKTWQDARDVAISLGFVDGATYRAGYRSDKRLPSDPPKFYSDFPGWRKFFKKPDKTFYSTCTEASAAAIEKGFISSADYFKSYQSDPKLPSSPRTFYPDFPGWDEFLGKVK